MEDEFRAPARVLTGQLDARNVVLKWSHANLMAGHNMTCSIPDDGQHVVDKLRSLHDGDVGVPQAIACGPRAIPALRVLLLAREPRGLFQARCRAVAALARLGAHQVLADFLAAHAEAADPVERVGDDAVMNAATLALGEVHDEPTFQFLLRRAEKRLMPGLIRALGGYRRSEAIPHLVAALVDDDCRPSAEAALSSIGAAARQELLGAAARPLCENDSESQLRAVRSALRLLLALGIPQGTWLALRHLVQHKDPMIAILACKICLANADVAEAKRAICRLTALMPHVDWMLRQDIRTFLSEYHDT